MNETATINWAKIREEQFPVFKHCTYLNTAANGLLPQSTVYYLHGHFQDYCNRASMAYPDIKAGMEQARHEAARLINASPDEIAFVPNVATGMRYLAQTFREVGSIALLEDDFPTVRSAWELSDYPIVDFSASPNGHIPEEAIEKAEADMLAISHVQWHTGFKIDPKKTGELCRSRDQLYILDATQSLGYTDIDVQDIQADVLLASSYKWLMGGFGSALMYVRKEILDSHPVRIHWIFWEKDGKLLPSARRFEIGHDRMHDILRFGAGIQLLQEIGMPAIEERVAGLNSYLREQVDKAGIRLLSDYSEEHRSAISILEGDENLMNALLKKNIATSVRGGGLRVAAHFYNTREDVDRLVREIKG